jgi:hypothetical protein
MEECRLTKLTAHSLISLVLVCTVTSSLFGSNAVIGIVSAEGTFHLDNNAANGHATFFDGNVIQTDTTAPRLDLKDGAWMHFGTHSRARISGHVVSLETGIGEIGSAKDYRILAKTLRINPADDNSVVRVQLAGVHRILVAAYSGPVQVFNGTGLLVATLKSGETMAFDPQPATVTTTGCLLTKNGRFIVVDPNDTSKVIELRGSDLSKDIGNQVTITGTAVPGATEVVAVTSPVSRVRTDGCSEVAAKVGADAPPITPGPTGSAVPKAAHSSTPYIVGGVAVAGGVIGAIVATRGSKSNQ